MAFVRWRPLGVPLYLRIWAAVVLAIFTHIALTRSRLGFSYSPLQGI